VTLDSNQHYHFSTLPEDDEEILDLVAKLNNAKLPKHAASAVKRDLNRLRKLPASSSDSAVLRIYIEYISDLPWSSIDNSELNLLSVRDQLDADHFG
jgi:ATP-dependent Lon protease